MDVQFNEKGIVPLIVQDADTRQVLCLFYANAESLDKMIKTREVWRYSRSKQKVMKKGESSGNAQELVQLSTDCDSDALLALVRQKGQGACHLNRWSCFSKRKFRSWGVLDELCATISQRREKKPKGSYVASIAGKPRGIGKKLREEAGELADALLNKTNQEVVWEAADLLFFTLVALENRRIEVEKVLEELKRRKR